MCKRHLREDLRSEQIKKSQKSVWTKNPIRIQIKVLIDVCLRMMTLQGPLDSKETTPVSPKGNQPWIFTGRTVAETEAPILWPPDAKSWLIGKDPDAEKDWGQEERRVTEDEMVGWHHRLNGHGFQWTPWVGDAIQPTHPVIPFSSCLQSFPTPGSFLMSQFSLSGGQSIGASASVLLINIQDWFPLGLTDFLGVQGKSLQHHSSSLLSLLYGPTLTSIHDYWKKHSFD